MRILYAVLSLASAALFSPLMPAWVPDLGLSFFLALSMTEARPGGLVALGVVLGVLTQALNPQALWLLPALYAFYGWFSWFLLQRLSMGPGARLLLFVGASIPQALIRAPLSPGTLVNVVSTAFLAYTLHYLWLRRQGL